MKRPHPNPPPLKRERGQAAPFIKPPAQAEEARPLSREAGEG